jgi:hypothetical protein
MCRFAVIAALLLAAAPAFAQTERSIRDAQPPGWEITPYVGVAVNSPSRHFIGVTPDRNHLFVGVHATVDIVRRERWTFAYAPEVVPLLLVTGNPRVVVITDEEGTGLFPGDPGPVAGFAVSPLGLEYQRRLNSRWRLYAATAGGVVWFSRDVPIPFARAFNYTFEGGAGFLWRRGAHTSLRFGYKLHHLSNNYTAEENPGLDGHVFVIGVSFNR